MGRVDIRDSTRVGVAGFGRGVSEGDRKARRRRRTGVKRVTHPEATSSMKTGALCGAPVPPMTASSLRCPGCGAPSASDAAACAYCGSAIATANCPSCFAPNAVGARYCASCGAAMLRAVDEDASPLPCPRCADTMAALTLGDVDVRECGACGGLWLDPATLQRLCDAREQHA